MAPEYAIHGRFSVKSDVFSFGVLVLEILSGRRIASFRSSENDEDLLTYVSKNILFYTLFNSQYMNFLSLMYFSTFIIGMEKLEGGYRDKYHRPCANDGIRN